MKVYEVGRTRRQLFGRVEPLVQRASEFARGASLEVPGLGQYVDPVPEPPHEVGETEHVYRCSPEGGWLGSDNGDPGWSGAFRRHCPPAPSPYKRPPARPVRRDSVTPPSRLNMGYVTRE